MPAPRASAPASVLSLLPSERRPMVASFLPPIVATVGLTGRYLVIPISQNQDTASAIAGPDPRFRPLGAEIVDNINLDITGILASKNERIVLSYDFKYGIDDYLTGLVKIPTGATTLSSLTQTIWCSSKKERGHD
ncbi:hypothetical protein JOM56_002910 [Amanita muscaria]